PSQATCYQYNTTNTTSFGNQRNLSLPPEAPASAAGGRDDGRSEVARGTRHTLRSQSAHRPGVTQENACSPPNLTPYASALEISAAKHKVVSSAYRRAPCSLARNSRFWSAGCGRSILRSVRVGPQALRWYSRRALKLRRAR